MTIADNINELIRPQTTTTRTDQGIHKVTHPPLIDQLNDTTTVSTLGSDHYTGNPTSKPPARLDAIALLQRIDRQSTDISTRLDMPVNKIIDRLSRIAGQSADLDNDTKTWIEHRTRSWVISARIITGHDAPAYQPDVPCPNTECERRSSLRIRLEDQIATCTECGNVWDEHTITQLGVYVRWAAEHLTGPRHWTTDDDGYPTECTACLDTRRAMAERAAARIQTVRSQRRSA